MNRESYSAVDSRLRRAGRLLSEPRVALAVFILFALVPAFVSGYPVYILPQYLLYGMLGMSLGILWGFTGILSFGQAAFFALGAYAMGLAAKASRITLALHRRLDNPLGYDLLDHDGLSGVA